MTTAEIQLDNVTFGYVRELVREHAGIALAADKDYLVIARLLPLAEQRGLRSVRELVFELRTSAFGELHERVIEAMTTNETSFFRDVHPFRVLKDVVLPQLIADRQASRTLTIWSAACSTGQEAYSIAILLAEHFPQLGDWHIQILATDIGRQVLAGAAQGEYTDLDVSRGLPPEALARHFERHGSQWRIKREIRKRVKFTRLNLVDPWPPMPRLDIVFLRNVLIYFDPESKRQVLADLKRRMAADGVLFLGGAESTLGIDNDWQRVSHGKTSTYRLGPNPAENSTRR